MSLSRRFIGKKNLDQVVRSAFEFISHSISDYEAALCSHVISEDLHSLLYSKENEIGAAEWKDDFDYQSFSIKALYTVCFNLLASGRLHICRGSLSTVGDSVYSLFTQVLFAYEEAGLLVGTCVEEQLDIVDDYISQVG